jgi:hypothetical protein
MMVSLSQAPWPWSLDQPQRPLNAAPGSALSGPLAEDPAPPAEGASEAPAFGAVPRPRDLPAPQRVSAGSEVQTQDRYTRSGAAGGGQTPPPEAPGPGSAGRQGIDLYV